MNTDTYTTLLYLIREYQTTTSFRGSTDIIINDIRKGIDILNLYKSLYPIYESTYIKDFKERVMRNLLIVFVNDTTCEYRDELVSYTLFILGDHDFIDR